MRRPAARELLRVNRALAMSILRQDLWFIGAGLVYIVAAERGIRMSVSSGVFAVSVLLLLAAIQMQVLMRAGPDLRNFLALPLRRDALLAVFYAGFALPGTLLLAVAGFAAALLAGSPGAGARAAWAVLGLIFVKSVIVNLLAAIRWHVLFVPVYLALLTGVYLFLIATRDIATEFLPFPAGAIAALFVAANLAFTFALVRELEF